MTLTNQTNTRVWRKHIFVLFVSTATQLMQVLFTLAIVLFGNLIVERLTGTPGTLVSKLSLAAAICGVWTAIHLTMELGRKASADDGEKTPLARRQALLTKISGPLRWSIAVIGGTATAGVSAGILVSSIVNPRLLPLLVSIYYLFLLAWIVIEIFDWYNDQYVLTEDRIIDITRLPVIYEQRTEAPLGMVQNASTSQRGLGVLLNYGDVQVETAGYSRPIWFENVWRPRLIQEAIFIQIDRMSRRNRLREREDMAAQTQRWLEAYHTLAGGIRDIQYSETLDTGRPMRIRWSVQGSPGRSYRTWLIWDVVSRANGGEYAFSARADGRAAYHSEDEWDGTSTGIHYVRGLRPPVDASAVFFRICVLFSGEHNVFSSPELITAIREPAQP